MKVGVVTFPGSLDDVDARRAVGLGGHDAVALWHGDDDLHGVDAVVLPGGFSYGDYLRAGAIARFAPMMDAVATAAGGPEGDADGLPVLGICNGFQILTESHLLPGSMVKNDHLHFICRDQELVVESTDTVWTRDFEQGQTITVPLKNQDGQYVADETTLDALEAEGRVVFRYQGWNPNGSRRDIAAQTSRRPGIAASQATVAASRKSASRETGTDTSCLIEPPSRLCTSDRFSRNAQSARFCASLAAIVASATSPSSMAAPSADSSSAAASAPGRAVAISTSA